MQNFKTCVVRFIGILQLFIVEIIVHIILSFSIDCSIFKISYLQSLEFDKYSATNFAKIENYEFQTKSYNLRFAVEMKLQHWFWDVVISEMKLM